MRPQKRGTFLLRLSRNKNKMVISCKDQNRKIRHFGFERVDDEIYRIGNTKQQKSIFQAIRVSNTFKMMYLAESDVRKKNVYF